MKTKMFCLFFLSDCSINTYYLLISKCADTIREIHYGETKETIIDLR